MSALLTLLEAFNRRERLLIDPLYAPGSGEARLPRLRTYSGHTRKPMWPAYLLLFFLASLLFAACSWGEDDEDAPSAQASVGGGANIPEINEGVYHSGEVHVEVSGDADVTIDATGSGYAQPGYALFQYVNGADRVSISFRFGVPDWDGLLVSWEGSFGVGGEWGRECDVTVDQPDDEVRGEFSCDMLYHIGPADFEVHVEGSFSASK